MRRMSFSLTTEQMRARTKTVTRRAFHTWRTLKAGDRLVAVEKAMGLPAGTKQVVLGVIEVVAVRTEWWRDITLDDVHREGFPDWGPSDFLRHVRSRGIDTSCDCRRIEFQHVPCEQCGTDQPTFGKRFCKERAGEPAPPGKGWLICPKCSAVNCWSCCNGFGYCEGCQVSEADRVSQGRLFTEAVQ